eukprot:CAMPEP_0116032260 /NCGR_PEP_ID=MMETSP0321-20121206/18055_1 /TAXON_ID=163516 /ORGANISM="Leptocylindrus danicus var. danicus, Strain B650" /LENGTH=131 /DNA_ID=CAMNT_0003507645 /DNA_START=225 /DNA_END=617 /DNA_ORIENTATION=+
MMNHKGNKNKYSNINVQIGVEMLLKSILSAGIHTPNVNANFQNPNTGIMEEAFRMLFCSSLNADNNQHDETNSNNEEEEEEILLLRNIDDVRYTRSEASSCSSSEDSSSKSSFENDDDNNSLQSSTSTKAT